MALYQISHFVNAAWILSFLLLGSTIHNRSCYQYSDRFLIAFNWNPWSIIVVNMRCHTLCMRIKSMLRQNEDFNSDWKVLITKGNDTTIITIVIKTITDKKLDQYKWSTNGCIDWSTASLGQKWLMTDRYIVHNVHHRSGNFWWTKFSVFDLT